MSSTRRASPTRSEGAALSPRREMPRRTLSVGSPARSNASGRLSSMIQEYRERNLGSFALSPMVRRSMLTDNTDIEEPRRKSWWKKLDENSRDIMEVMEVNNVVEPNNIIEELDIEVLSQENKNYTLDLPESSDSESINSIVIPQRKLFIEKENVPQKKFGHFGTRDTLSKLHKTNAATNDKPVTSQAKELFPNKPRSKPIFPAALLNMSPNKTTGDKTLTAEPKGQVRNIFGNRQGTKRKNMFANFIVSESEDEIPEIQPKVFEFQKKPEMIRRPSSSSRCARDASPASSNTTDMELDDWKLLPSSTMVETQLEALMAGTQTPKRVRLSKLSEAKESDAGTNSTETGNRTKQSNKSTLSKNKSKTMTKEKSPESNTSVSTRNRSKVAHNEDIQLNKSKQNKSQPTSPRNNDVNISQSSVITRSRDKSGVIDTMQNSINKSQSNANKSKNSLNRTNNKAPIAKNNTSIIKNISKSQVLEQVEQNDDDELNFTLEYENDNIADEIDVAKELNQQNTSVILKSNKNINDSGLKNQNREHNTNKTSLRNKSQNEHDAKKHKENQMQVDEVEHNSFENKNHTEVNESSTKDDENKQNEDAEMINENETEEEQNKNHESHYQSKELAIDDKNNKSQEQSRDIDHKSDQEVENDDENEVGQEMSEDENEESQELQNEIDDEEIQSQEVQNKSQEEQNETEEEQNESQEEQNESQDLQNESQEEHNDSQELQNESQEEENESQEIQNESQEEQNESEEIQNESQEDQNESQEVQNESEEIQNESQEEQNESQEAHNESQGEQNETEEEENENEIEDENQEIEESQETSENHQQNTSQEEMEQNESLEVEQDMEYEDANDSADEVAETDQEDNQETQSDQEVETDENNDNQQENTEELDTDSPNVSHDTTGRHRKKDESPEVILHDSTNQAASFTVHGRNTSVRKTKSMIKNLNIRPSLEPVRESIGFSDGTKNSSAEGSGWDSHRTTRKTLRQTFGRDFTPRKSLRAWVMEKSAKRQTVADERQTAADERQTMADDITSVTSKFPQANSTELPDESSNRDDYGEMNEEPQQSEHEVSKRTRQTMLEMYLQKIKKQNVEYRARIEESVKNSLKAPPRDALNPFKIPARPMFRRQISKPVKPKAKPIRSLISLGDLPEEVIQDMKYKPPKRFQPSNAPWITKRLYKYLETKLEPKYDYKTRIRAEKLVETLYHFVKEVRRHDGVANSDAVDVLKHEMARLGIVKTHFEFYDFFHEFMPREVRIKVIPDAVNKIPVPRNGVFSDIID